MCESASAYNKFSVINEKLSTDWMIRKKFNDKINKSTHEVIFGSNQEFKKYDINRAIHL